MDPFVMKMMKVSGAAEDIRNGATYTTDYINMNIAIVTVVVIVGIAIIVVVSVLLLLPL